MNNWIEKIPENPQFKWIKTSKEEPCPHTIILFVDSKNNFHYGVLGSELSQVGRKNKYWCHITNRHYDKKSIVLWSYVPEHEAMKILRPHLSEEFRILSNNVQNKIMNIEISILKDIENDDCASKPYSEPGVIVRNCLYRFMKEIMMIEDF